MTDVKVANISIGFSDADDLPAMADLLHELFTLEKDFRPDRSRQLAGLSLIHENPALGRLFALYHDDQLVGMANLLFSVSTAEGGRVGLLEDVIIAAPYRGRGLGSQLLQHVCAWAKEQGLCRITLLADYANVAALQFYNEHGFGISAMTVRRKYL